MLRLTFVYRDRVLRLIVTTTAEIVGEESAATTVAFGGILKLSAVDVGPRYFAE